MSEIKFDADSIYLDLSITVSGDFELIEKHKMQLVIVVHLENTSISYHVKSQTETQTYFFSGETSNREYPNEKIIGQ